MKCVKRERFSPNREYGGWRAVLLFQGRVAAWQSTLVAPHPQMPTTPNFATVGVCVKCQTCGKTFYGFNRKFLLKRHMITHTGEKPFHCPHCPHRANLKQNLEVHIKRKHKDQLAIGEIPAQAQADAFWTITFSCLWKCNLYVQLTLLSIKRRWSMKDVRWGWNVKYALYCRQVEDRRPSMWGRCMSLASALCVASTSPVLHLHGDRN